MKTIEWPDFLAQQAIDRPNCPALYFEGETWSFLELDRRATTMARQLLRLNIESSGRVGLLATNSPGYVTLVHAAIRARSILVPLNTRMTITELQQQIERAQIHLLIHDQEFQSSAIDVASRMPILRLKHLSELTEEAVQTTVRRPAEPIPVDQIQNIIFTSGTTGQPKGALLTYGNFVSNALASDEHLGHAAQDRWLAAMPLFHVGGLAILMRSVVCGFTVELHQRFDPNAVNDRVQSGQVTIISVVSTMLQRLLNKTTGEGYPEALRLVLLGGGPAPIKLVSECIRRRIPVAPSYGMTETCSQIATLLPKDVVHRRGSSGRPLPGNEIRIDTGTGHRASDTAGEILVRGPAVSPGYLDGDNSERFEDGWFRTGDIGRLDKDGYLYVLDRRNDLIISGGENIYPAEVEAVLVQHPVVVEAAVVPWADEEWGQVPIAFVVLVDVLAYTQEDLESFCRERLAAYRVPRKFIQVDGLPRNSGGKVLRRVLQSRQAHF